MRRMLSAVVIGLAAASAAGAQTTVYANTFSAAPGAEWSVTGGGTPGAGTTGSACSLGTPFCGGYLGLSAGGTVTPFPDRTAALMLSGLAAHRTATLRFDLLVLQSWDGNDAYPGVGPDIFRVTLVGGTVLLNTSFRNMTFGRGPTQCYSIAMPNCPADNPPFSGATAHAVNGADIPNTGFGYEDAGYLIQLTFAHVDPSMVLRFTGTGGMQGWPDEGWAIADVMVLTDAPAGTVTPEPSTPTMLAAGLLTLCGMGVVCRRGRHAQRRTDGTAMIVH